VVDELIRKPLVFWQRQSDKQRQPKEPNGPVCTEIAVNQMPDYKGFVDK
jgi:hypothetical protein